MVKLRRFFAKLFMSMIAKIYYIGTNPEVQKDFVLAKPGQSYTLYSSKKAGFYGGILDCSNLLVGESVELNLFLDIEGKDVRADQQIVEQSSIAPAPLLILEEVYAPKGITVTFSQLDGLSRGYTYYIYRK